MSEKAALSNCAFGPLEAERSDHKPHRNLICSEAWPSFSFFSPPWTWRWFCSLVGNLAAKHHTLRGAGLCSWALMCCSCVQGCKSLGTPQEEKLLNGNFSHYNFLCLVSQFVLLMTITQLLLSSLWSKQMQNAAASPGSPYLKEAQSVGLPLMTSPSELIGTFNPASLFPQKTQGSLHFLKRHVQ